MPAELFDSVQGICYTFVALIHKYVIDEGQTLMLKLISQDICENHFGHCRYFASGSSYSLSQAQADNATRTSNMRRQHGMLTGAVSKSANSKSADAGNKRAAKGAGMEATATPSNKRTREDIPVVTTAKK
jgi:hypothetical protein